MMSQVRKDTKSGGEGSGQTDSAVTAATTHTHAHTHLPGKCLYIDSLNLLVFLHLWVPGSIIAR